MLNLRCLLFVLLLTGSFFSYATRCTIDGGAQIDLDTADTNELQVQIHLTNDGSRVILDGFDLECKFMRLMDESAHDNMYVEPPGLVFLGKFTGLGGGLEINGVFASNPLHSRTKVAELPGGAAPPYVKLNIYPYVVLKDAPQGVVDIRAGDLIGEYDLFQDNNYNSSENRLKLQLVASNDFVISPSLCAINNNDPINVDFGTVSMKDIGVNPATSQIVVNEHLTYTCPDKNITLPITVTMIGAGAGFNKDVLGMNNPDLGVAMLRKGIPVSLNRPFVTQMSDGFGSDDVSFTLIKKAGSTIPVGNNSGSAIMVIGVE